MILAQRTRSSSQSSFMPTSTEIFVGPTAILSFPSLHSSGFSASQTVFNGTPGRIGGFPYVAYSSY